MSRKGFLLALLVLPLALSSLAIAQQRASGSSPGLQPYVPTRIDWLTTTLQASLRSDISDENKFVLQITAPDAETILIYVRYLPTVDREAMNREIDSAREVIKITAKSYGWDKWLRIREDIQLARPEKR